MIKIAAFFIAITVAVMAQEEDPFAQYFIGTNQSQKIESDGSSDLEINWDLNCSIAEDYSELCLEEKSVTPIELNVTATDLFDLDSDIADDENGTNWFYYRDFLTGMDSFQEVGTDAVIVMASGIDYGLYSMFDDDDANTTTESAISDEANMSVQALNDDESNTSVATETDLYSDSNESLKMYVKEKRGEVALPKQVKSKKERKGERTFLMSMWFDEGAKNQSFLNLSDDSYIRLRGGYVFNQKGDSEFIHSITARVKIPRTKDRFDLIIGDETKRSNDLSFEGTKDETDDSVAIGVENIFGFFDEVKSSFRVGFSGITNPYAKWRLKYEMLAGSWLIEPAQNFRYSKKNEFEEWTNLYFKRRTSSSGMFSLLLQRSTETGQQGMEYLIQPAHHHSLKSYGTLTTYIGVYGRTKEQKDRYDNGNIAKEGVFAYSVGVSWKKQSSRKYIVYNLQPILAYTEEYDFHPNYILKATLEFYFGLRD